MHFAGPAGRHRAITRSLDGRRHPRRRGRRARVPEPDRRPGGRSPATIGAGGRLLASTPPRRSRPARAGCSSPTTTPGRPRPDRCACTASAATPGSATPRAAPGTTRSRTPGYKYNMTDIAAALGLVQLDAGGRAARGAAQLVRGVHRAARAPPRSADLLELPADAADGSHAWHLYIVRLHLDRLSIDRAAVIDALQGGGHRDERPFHPAAPPPVLPANAGGTRQRRSRWRAASTSGSSLAAPVAGDDPRGRPARHGVARRRARRGAARLAGSAEDGGDGPGKDLKIEERRPRSRYSASRRSFAGRSSSR